MEIVKVVQEKHQNKTEGKDLQYTFFSICASYSHLQLHFG